ncbi:putative oxygenase MesX [Demequina sp. NBRC 110051]|uniref:putative oxygenase MesX n=1 Tax=Demequina sp. NBRC 110051 TaxID=1570340 RepID=UPI0009FC33D4|nr:putative oxygenase MesX [Demequina sp. NBRC 110051]
MSHDFTFTTSTTRFDENYTPSASTRATTNFANLARGELREQNLRNTLTMINRRFNDLADWDNPTGDRYELELDIVSASVQVDAEANAFPLLEVLDVTIVDRRTGERRHGIVGNNFSSYVRDYDFSVRLPASVDESGKPALPADFGDLHGKLFQGFVGSDAYRERFSQAPVICISVSTSKTYVRTANHHPVLGVEYTLEQEGLSLTDAYFAKMGLQVRYFMPRGSVAPLALYFRGDLVNDYTDLQLAGTIATMETFQKIYRPEIYNANSAAPAVFRPSLESQDFSRTQIDYDRVERSQLGASQGKYTEEHFIEPHRELLERWAAGYLAPASSPAA